MPNTPPPTKAISRGERYDRAGKSASARMLASTQALEIQMTAGCAKAGRSRLEKVSSTSEVSAPNRHVTSENDNASGEVWASAGV